MGRWNEDPMAVMNDRLTRRAGRGRAVALAMLLMATTLASRPALARVAIRPGPGNHAEFYTTETGQRFLPRGVNYVRLGTHIPGIADKNTLYHNLFCPGTYTYGAPEAPLREIRASGYNVVRVFMTPTCMTADMPPWTLNATVVSYIANFLWIANNVGVKVVLTMDDSLPPGYRPPDESAPLPANLGYLNYPLLRPEYVSAKARFWRDLVVMLEQQSANITNSLLSIDMANEPAFHADPGAGAPFDKMTGWFRDGGRDYDMASPASRQELADAAFARYVSWIRGDLRQVQPDLLVTIGITPPHEVKLAGYNGLDLRVASPGRPATEFRYPPRLRVAEPFIDYYSIHSYPAGTTPLDYLLRTLASIEYSNLDVSRRPIELGELGASRLATPTVAQAAGTLSQYISLLDQLAFAGFTMWTWDLFETADFWNMKDAGGHINGAVSPVGRPGYGSGGLSAGVYLVQGTSVIYHNGRDAACTYIPTQDYYDATGLTSTAGLPGVLGAGAVRMDRCPLIARSGAFSLGGALYYSNGATAYCWIPSWDAYVRLTGKTTLPDSVLHRAPDMRFDGTCRI